MHLRMFFKMLFLGPLIPLIGVPDNGDASDNSNNDNNGNDDSTNDSAGDNLDNNDNNTNDNSTSSNDEKLYTAKELESRIEKRLKRDRIQQKKQFDAERAKEKLTDIEKANFERDEARKEAEKAIKTANEQLVKATVKEFSVKLNIVDSDAAYALMNLENVDVENGKVSGVEESLKELIKQKTYLVKTSSNDNPNVGDNQTGGSNTKKNDINSWIRKAARGG